MEDPAYNRLRRLLCVVIASIAVSSGCVSDSIERPVAPVAPIPVAPTKEVAPLAAIVENTQVSTAEIAQPSKPLPIPPKPLPLPPTGEPTVAIRIEELAPSARITIDSADGRLQLSLVGAPPSESPWIATAPIEVRVQSVGWHVSARGSATRVFAAGELEIRPVKGSTTALSCGKKKWPGELRVVRTPSGIDLVIDVPMESYLPGVIAKELYGSWSEATFRAQAVAARSYAVVEAARWEGRRHYDMVAGQQSQAWVGATDNPKAVAAVRDTRGQVLVHDGVVVPAYYSSACGGRPASALGVVTDNPYHDIAPLSAGGGASRSSCCQSTAVASWKATIPLATIQSRLQSWGRGIGRDDLAALQLPTTIMVAEKNAAGRATAIRMRGRTGAAVEIDAEDFRRAINAAGEPKTSLRSGDFSVRISAKNAEFTGRGFGHGVGLCQHGAQEMGRAGSSYKQILARYYPDSMIVKAWK
ncbi:MAG: SpoIID/LytB domain-containing protein [Phycisphaerales bacterium]|nr:SpoIID/LytB domain-containing protein [Phycisphaerales bacterium]